MKHRLLLLGATGRTGALALEYALARGHDVVALVRNPEKVVARSDRLRILPGDLSSPDDVSRAIEGADAVVSALNNNRTSDMPWARPVSPALFMARAIGHCIQAMRSRGIRRIVVLTAVGVGDSFPHAPLPLRVLIRRTNLRATYDDHEAQEAALRSSGLDWTAVRAAGLTNGHAVKRLVVSYGGHPKLSLTVSRTDVAEFMIDCLDEPAFFQKAPAISTQPPLAAMRLHDDLT